LIILFGSRFRVGESSSCSRTSASASRESRSASEGSTGTLRLRSCDPDAGHMDEGEGETTSLLLGGACECICGRLAVRRTSERKKGTESKCDDGGRFSGVVSSESIEAIDDVEDTVLR